MQLCKSRVLCIDLDTFQISLYWVNSLQCAEQTYLFTSRLLLYFNPSLSRTFAEAHRVLRPGGTIAIFGHGLPEANNPEMKPIIEQVL